MPLDIVKRSEWTKYEEENPQKIVHPAHIVWYTTTCTRPCTDGESCRQRAKAMLREHRLDFHRKDIAYNFLIGGDGRIYEAKGWFDAPDLPVQYLGLRHKSIYIAFIYWHGTYNEIPKLYYQIAEEMVKYGIENNFVPSKFVLNDLMTPYAQKRRLENGEFIHNYLPAYM